MKKVVSALIPNILSEPEALRAGGHDSSITIFHADGTSKPSLNYPDAELRGIKMYFTLLTPMQSIEEFF